MTFEPAYRIVPHTADMAFEAEAPDWPSLLAVATVALAEIIRADEEDGVGEEERRVDVSGSDREDVLVAWLTECLLLFESEGFLARAVAFESATDTSARGRLRGHRYDPVLEPPDRVVKAVTYHDLVVRPGTEDAPWRTTVVLDL